MSIYSEEILAKRKSIVPHPDVDYDSFRIDAMEEAIGGPIWYYDPNNEIESRRYAYFKQFCIDHIDKRGGPSAFLTADKFFIAGQRNEKGEKIKLQGKYEKQYAQTSTAAQLWRRHVQLPMLLFTLAANDGLEDGYDWIYEQIIIGTPYAEIASILGMRGVTFLDWVMGHLDPNKLVAAKEARTEYQLQKATRAVDKVLDSDLISDADLMREAERAKIISNVTVMLKYTSTARHTEFKPKSNNISVDAGVVSINFTPKQD